MADINPARAIDVVTRVVRMCDFIEHPAIKTAAAGAAPVPIPPDVGALGFDIRHWVGLGIVGLWAALDEFSLRAALSRPRCATCGRKCVPARFASYAQGDEGRTLEELDDLRHLYAHYTGEADAAYFDPERQRHVLAPDIGVLLTCGVEFGRQTQLGLADLRFYSSTVKSVLERFP
jgi:hypothetical protein